MILECFPYLRVSDGEAAIAFYTEVLGARERMRLTDPGDGRVGHAELVLDNGAVLMLSDAYPEHGIYGPEGRAGLALHLHVDDCDALLARAEAAGATITEPAADQFHGERSGKFRDPFGHEWYVGHSLEELDPTEMQRRWDAMT